MEDNSENGKYKSKTSATKKVLSKPGNTLRSMGSSLTGGKNAAEDLKHYRNETKMDAVSSEYKKEYSRQLHEYEKHNDPGYHGDNNGVTKILTGKDYYSSPAERDAYAKASAGLEETVSRGLSTGTSEESRGYSGTDSENIQYSKTSSGRTDTEPHESDRSSYGYDRGSQSKGTAWNERSQSPASRREEFAARRGLDESSFTGLKTGVENRENTHQEVQPGKGESYRKMNENTESPLSSGTGNQSRQSYSDFRNSVSEEVHHGPATVTSDTGNGKSVSSASSASSGSKRYSAYDENGKLKIGLQGRGERYEQTQNMPATAVGTGETDNRKPSGNVKEKMQNIPDSAENAVSKDGTGSGSSNILTNFLTGKPLQTGLSDDRPSITITDDTGTQLTLKTGDAVLLNNGAIIGFDVDENNEGFVFTNFFDNKLAGDDRNILNGDMEGFVTEAMTLKTAVNVNEKMNISEIVNAEGIKIITIQMNDNDGLTKLATQIRQNDQTKNTLLEINKEKLQKLKTDAKITIGAVIIVRGATFVVNKAISATSLLFDGMGTDKNEIEYATDKIVSEMGDKAKKAGKKATKKIMNKPVTAIKATNSKIISKLKNKVSYTIGKRLTQKLSKTKFGRKLLTAGRKFGKAGKVLSGLIKVIKMKLKKYIIIIVACCLIISSVLLLSASIINSVMSVFGFLFGSSETSIWEDYEDYITGLNGKISSLNSNYSSKGIVPKSGIELPTSPITLKNKASSYNISLQENGNYSAIPQHDNKLAYTVKVDEEGTPETRYYYNLGTTYSGSLKGINWRAFFACLQVYNESSSKNAQKTIIEDNGEEYDASDTLAMYRPDKINPFGNYKNLWDSTISDNDFLDISVSAVLDTNCYVDSKGIESDGAAFNKYQEELVLYAKGKRIAEEQEAYNKAISNTDEGDYKKYYYPAKKAEYVHKYGTEEGFKCTYSQFLKAVKNGTYKLSVKTPDVDDNATNIYNKYKTQGGPEEIRHAYQISYYMTDNGNQSLSAYDSWFGYQYYVKDAAGNTSPMSLTKENQEMLDTLYASTTIFDGFPDVVREILLKCLNINFELGNSGAISSKNYEFIMKIVQYHYEAKKKYNVLCSVSVAQAIEESGWGTSNLTEKANNLFGMKGKYNGEYYDNGSGNKWRKYPSWKESVEDHARLLCNENYNCAGITDYKTVLLRLQRGGYCEGAGYTTRISSLIETYNLTQYDNLTSEQLEQIKNGTYFADGGQTLDGIVYYNQGDYPNVAYGSSTLAKSGCAPTSMAIVISTLTGQNVTPKQTGDYAAANGCYVSGAGSTHNTPNLLAAHWGLNCYETSSLNDVKSALTSKKMVVCLITGTSKSPGKSYRDSSHGGHFMVLYGYDRNTDQVYTADCGSRAKSTCVNSSVKWNINIFASLDQGGVVKHSYWIIG